MKMSVLTAAALLALVSYSAAAAEPWSSQPRDQAVMLYFSKSFGSDQPANLRPLAFGLRFQQQSTFDLSRPVALMDARFSLGGRKQFLFGGLNAFDSGDSSGRDSSTDSTASSGEEASGSGKWSARNPGWTIVLVAVTLAAGGCIIDWCQSDDDEEDTGTDTSTGTPGT